MELSALALELSLTMVLMAFSAEIISKGVENLENVVGQGLAGGVILGNLTAFPETVIVLEAVLNHDGDVALGSSIAGNVVLFTLGLGLVGVAYRLKWGSSLTMKGDFRQELGVMSIVIVLLGVAILIGQINPILSLFLFSIYGYYLVKRVKGGNVTSKISVKALIEIMIGGTVVVLLSPVFLSLITNLALIAMVSKTWISMVLTPVVAELEEGISAMRLALRSKGGGSTAIVSYFGSKIQNSTILLGLVGLDMVEVHGLYLLITILSSLIGVMVIYDGKLTVGEGVVLCLSYFAFMYLALVFSSLPL
ncbi:sodium:calcium antiporter [Metallosphaera tengchongensis]|uniref:Sodium:calcium antiporter n=2 Tax=Metallosphaera tengchongensis TaxID=1532350 RepID=A0A6N0NZG0_9CREN|nr:sodium:calcium antiporter [Metallosphaera tengchongensis]